MAVVVVMAGAGDAGAGGVVIATSALLHLVLRGACGHILWLSTKHPVATHQAQY